MYEFLYLVDVASSGGTFMFWGRVYAGCAGIHGIVADIDLSGLLGLREFR